VCDEYSDNESEKAGEDFFHGEDDYIFIGSVGLVTTRKSRFGWAIMRAERT
jgi:hypothetical protein